jgi:hypothetical protein
MTLTLTPGTVTLDQLRQLWAGAAASLAPEALVLATSEDVQMVISLGVPTQVAARQDWRFVEGLLGAALAIGSAMALAIVVQGGLR